MVPPLLTAGQRRDSNRRTQMKIILLERVGRYGGIGDEVNVKDGFARNFLLPQGKALRATAPNRAKFEAERAAIEKRNDERREQAAGIASGLNGHSLVMIRQAGETGQLYGSVSSRDIADGLVADGFQVSRGQVSLATPIKTVGLHTIELDLHPEVEINITVNVARSEDEAKRQSKGEDMTVFSYDDEEDEAQAASAEDEAEDGAEGDEETEGEEPVVDGAEAERQEDA